MDGFQSILNFLLSAASALVIWILTDLKKDVRDLNKEVHDKYVQKDSYIRDIDEIKDMLERIFDKLDQKEDKKWIWKRFLSLNGVIRTL